jgi:hypothetical protein
MIVPCIVKAKKKKSYDVFSENFLHGASRDQHRILAAYMKINLHEMFCISLFPSNVVIHCLLLDWLYNHCESWPLFQFPVLFTDDRTPWTRDQLVARPLPTHRTTQNRETHIHIKHSCPNWGSNPQSQRPRASEDSSCLRPLGYSDQPLHCLTKMK